MARATGSRSTNRPRDPLNRLEADAHARCVDLKLIFVRATTGARLFEVGGRWDSIDKRYLDEPPTECKVFRINEAQPAATAALAEWIAARREGRPRRVEILLDGGRGSGKTVLGVMAVFAIAIAFPDARCFLIPTAATRRGEIVRIVRDHIPPGWRTWSERDLTYTLPNGSTISYVGSDDEDALRFGGYEVALGNELQLFTSDAYSTLAAGVRNVSERPKGLFIGAMNYASKVRGEWTEDHLDQIDAGKLNAIRFTLDPRLNQFVESDVVDDVDALIRSVRPDLADKDAQGIRRRLGDMAAPAFNQLPISKGGHVGMPLVPPHGVGWRDVTRERTSGRIGRTRVSTGGYALVAAADFNLRPGCCATVFRIFDRGDGKPVYFAERWIPADDNEDDLSKRLTAYADEVGLTVKDILVVADTSGSHQNVPRDGGKPSHRIMREWGFDVISPVDPKPGNASGEGQNPGVEDSLAQFHDVCREDRFLVAPSEEWVVRCLARCKTKKRGFTIRLDDKKPGYSHAVDTCRYMTWRFEPRRGPVRTLTPDRETRDQVRALKIFDDRG